MKLRGLLTACALLAVLSGLLWWSNRKEARASREPVESKSVKLFTAPEDQIQEIKIQKQIGENIHLRRNAGKWQIAGGCIELAFYLVVAECGPCD
jgi:hypothetical protein